MMKVFGIMLIFLQLGVNALAQLSLTGVVTDGKDALPYCNVILQVEDSSIVAGAITDDEGQFNMSAPLGSYLLRISFVGFEDYTETIDLTVDVDRGTLVLNGSGNELEEVLVTAQKRLIQRQPDRLIYNLAGSIAAQGSDMSEAIALAPGISIQNGVLSMIGRGASRVMVDGRLLQLEGQDLLDYLSSIPSDYIETIEVITNPPARYEASGNGGIINLIYKKGRNNSWKNTSTLSYTKDRNGFASLRNNLQYNRGQHELSISLNSTLGETWATEFGGTNFPSANQTWNAINTPSQDQVGGRIAYDFIWSDRTQIGMQYQCTFVDPNVNGSTITVLDLLENEETHSFINNGNNDRNKYTHIANAHILTTLDTSGIELAVDADYFVYRQDGVSVFDVEAFDQANQFIGLSRSRTVHSSQEIKNYSIKADLEHPTKTINWNYGIKYSQSISDNEILNFDRITGSSIVDMSLSNTFEYQENISAAYLSGSKQLNSKWNLQMGLRLERTRSNGYSETNDERNNNGFTTLFPTAFLDYQYSEDHQYNLNIGGRVNRASFRDLNPFRIHLTNTAYSEGNPFIQPSFTYTFNVNYIYKGRYTTTAYFNRERNGFGTLFVPFKEDLVLATLRDNFYDANYFGIGELFSLDFSPKWSTQNQIYLMYSHTSVYDNYDALGQNGFQLYISNNHNVTLGKGWNCQLNVWYSSAARRNIFEIDALWSINIGLKKKLLEDRIQISLNANDIFNQSGLDRLSSEINGVVNTYGQNYSSRNVRLSISYNFGNDKVSVRDRKFGNEETQRRS